MVDIKIPDVSEFQSGNSAPNWAGIKALNGGAGIIRVGYGANHLDHMFVSNYTAMKQNKFLFMGLYHYLVAGQDPLAQARQFCNWVGPPSAVALGTVFMLDLEVGSGDQSGRANTWHNYVDHFYGLDKLPLDLRSWLYSYTSFVREHNLSGIFASPRRTWIASYSSSEPSIGHSLWQSTDGVTGAHITNWPGCGRCDTSIAHVDLRTLASIAHQLRDTLPTPPTSYTPVHTLEENVLRADEKTTAIAFGNSAYDWISFFSDPDVEGKPDQQIRIAPWSSDGQDFAGITTVTVGHGTEKVTVALPSHCAGISIQRTQSAMSDWAPIAWNLGSNA